MELSNAKMDMKKRAVFRNSKHEYYHVQKFAEGQIGLESRELADSFEISQPVLNMIDAAIKNVKKGKVSEPVDLTEFEA